jgi:hypothetical protein
MSKQSFVVMLSTLALAAVMGNTTPKAAETGDSCKAFPGDAVTTAPAPLRKWGRIVCTPVGQVLTSRGNWIWARLDGEGIVVVPAQMVSHPVVGEAAYFTSIAVRDITPEEFTFAFRSFGDGVQLDQKNAHGYRVDFTSVLGNSTTMYFFDFATFAGGVWCPEDNCVMESRFLIVEMEHDTDARSASI